jgi:ABC-type sugar transport system permease subunit
MSTSTEILVARPVSGISLARLSRARWAARLVPFSYLIPAAALLILFTYWPLLYTIVLSLFRWNLVSPDMEFVGLGNFIGLTESPMFDAAMRNTFIYVVGSIPLKVLLPLPIAAFLWALGGRRSAIYKVILFLPTILSFVVVALIWMWMLNPIGGIVSALASGLGYRLPPLLGTSETALWTILGISTWKIIGFNTMLYLAGLSAVNRDHIDAMRLDGANDIHLLRYLIWPLLTPTTLFVLIATVVFSLQQVFTPIDVLTRGGPANATTNLFYMVYVYTFESFNVGFGAAGTTFLFFLILFVTVVKLKLLERWVHYQ